MPGLEVDLDLGPVEIMAGVRAELSEMNRHNAAEAAHRRRETARARVPVDARLVTVGTGVDGTDLLLSVGGPDAGYYWLLRRLVIGGLLWDTTAAGDAEVYVTGLSFPMGSAGSLPANTLTLSDLVDHAATLPNIAYYSPHQLIVQANENLVVLIGGATNAQQYVMAAQFQVFRTIAAGEEFQA